MTVRLANFIAATALTPGDVFYITQGGVEKQLPASILADSISLPLTAPTGSSLVGFIPVGTGAVATDVQTKLRGIREPYVYGREYLSHFHKKIISQNPLYPTSSTSALMTFSGDSTTVGYALTDMNFTISNLMQQKALAKGFSGIKAANAGHSGATSLDWTTSFLAADLATNPDVYIVRWGINDPLIGYTPAQSIASIRAGLATIRASKNLATMSIVLQSPNSVSTSPDDGRDINFLETLNVGLRQAAMDYQCCYVDTFSYLKDSVNSGDFMDALKLHPLEVENTWIASLLGEALFPDGLQFAANNQIINATSATPAYAGYGLSSLKAAADAPFLYPQGISMFKTSVGGGWPYNGIVITHKYADGYLFQKVVSVDSGLSNFAYRVGLQTTGTGTWNPWQDSSPTSGTWTPVIFGDSVAGTNTYSTQKGDYEIIGSGIVTAHFSIQMATKDAAMAGNISVGGFPFVASPSYTSSPFFSLANWGNITLAGGYTHIGMTLNVNSTSGPLFKSGSGLALATVAPSEISAISAIYGSVTYRTGI